MDLRPRDLAIAAVFFCIGGLVAAATATALTVAIVLVALEEEQPEITGATLEERIESGEVVWQFDDTDPLLHSRRILVTTEINELTSKHVITALLHLNDLDSQQPIDLFLRSNGGWAFHGAAIIDAMKKIDAPVNTWALGECGSAATEILAAGTGGRYAGESSVVMIHLLGYEELTSEYDFDQVNETRDRRFWAKHATLPTEWFEAGEEWYYLLPEKAVELGVVDEIITNPHGG